MRSHEFSQYHHNEGLEYTSYQEDIQKIPSPLSQAVSSLKDKIRGVLQWTKKTLRPQVAVQEEPVVVEKIEMQVVTEQREDTTNSSIPLFVRTAPYVEVTATTQTTFSAEEVKIHEEMAHMHDEIRHKLLPELAEQSGYNYEQLWFRFIDLSIEHPGDPRIAFNILQRAIAHSSRKGNTQFVDTSIAY